MASAINPNAPTTLDKLDKLIAMAERARDAAADERLFDSIEGLQLTNAAFDLFECDQLYDLASDITDSITPEPQWGGWNSLVECRL